MMMMMVIAHLTEAMSGCTGAVEAATPATTRSPAMVVFDDG